MTANSRAERWDMIQSNTCVLSIASIWEMAIKTSIGKLKLPKSLAEIAVECEAMGIEICGITVRDCMVLQNLPWNHRDPFDRIILSHAMAEGMPLISHDGNVRSYAGVDVVW